MNKNITNTINLLNRYKPKDIRENVYKEQMLELINTCENSFSRESKIGHFTASCLLLNKNKTHILLTHHRKLERWLQLGGHCDGDPDVMNVAMKESIEESGIEEIKPLSKDIFDIGIHLIPANKKEEAHYHFDIRFLLHAYSNNNFKISEESKDLKWVELNSKDTTELDESLSRMLKKLQYAEIA
jgi:8-oxo-dGTP pyrophosphatase MutT (NUDIX family)